jgi:hypothetical protein
MIFEFRKKNENKIQNFFLKMKLWKLVAQKHPVWYFDATGSVINNIKFQNRPYLYTILFHDREKEVSRIIIFSILIYSGLSSFPCN